jgi:hypothetical protein
MNSGFCTCKVGSLLLEAHLQSILLGYFVDEISQATYLGWPQTLVLCISASKIARITDMKHWNKLHAFFTSFEIIFIALLTGI